MSKLLFASMLVLSSAVPIVASAAAPAGSLESFAESFAADAALGRRVACYARDRRGFTFEGVGFDRREAEDRALRKCYSTSRECFVTGCREVFLREGD